jgi:hypothetical protein
VPTAQASAKWKDASSVWLDHATLRATDAAWLDPVSWLTLWAVKVPPALLASLPNLRYLDIRGGSGTDLRAVEGCTELRYLQVNQVRGLTDLAVLPELASLRLLSLYGLPKVAAIPSLANLRHLERLELGSMKGLAGLTGAHDAPALRELLLIRSLGVAVDDADRLAGNDTLQQFDWFSEDVPVRVWQPFVAAVDKAPAKAMHADEWLRQRGHL